MKEQSKHSDVYSRVRALLFWGTWLLFAPGSIFVLWTAAQMLLSPYKTPGIEAKVCIALLAVIVVLAPVPWVCKVTRDYLAERRAEGNDSE